MTKSKPLRFGVILGGDPTKVAAQAQLLHANGLTDMWFGEVPTVGWGDPVVCMGLAARVPGVQLGTAIVPAGLRQIPILANQLATIDRLAPGRVTLGYGSGRFSRAVIGLPPIGLRDFAHDLAQLRALLSGESVSIGDQPVRLPRPGGGRGKEQGAIGLLVAAGGPKTAALAGRYGEGILASGEFDPARLRVLVDSANAARAEAARTGRFRVCVESGPLCVLRPHETLRTDRVVAMVQPAVSGYFGYYLGLGLDAEELPAAARDSYVQFLNDARESFGTTRQQQLLGIAGSNYLGRIPSHDRFVTPAVIEAMTLTGTASFLADRLNDMRHAGVTEIIVMRAFDLEWTEGDDLRDLVSLCEQVG